MYVAGTHLNGSLKRLLNSERWVFDGFYVAYERIASIVSGESLVWLGAFFLDALPVAS
jgi:hypothetical protein